MNHYQQLYGDTLTEFGRQLERSRALNDDARVSWLKEAQQLIDREIADFKAVNHVE